MARARTRRFLSPKESVVPRLSELERGTLVRRTAAPREISRREIPPSASTAPAASILLISQPPHEKLPIAPRNLPRCGGRAGGGGGKEDPACTTSLSLFSLSLSLCHPRRVARPANPPPLFFSFSLRPPCPPSPPSSAVPVALSRGKPSALLVTAATLRRRIHFGGDLIRINWDVMRLSGERFVKRLFNLGRSYSHPARIAIYRDLSRATRAGATRVMDYRRISLYLAQDAFLIYLDPFRDSRITGRDTGRYASSASALSISLSRVAALPKSRGITEDRAGNRINGTKELISFN